MAETHVGFAQADAEQTDQIRSMLDLTRRRGTRGTLRTRRELWRFCTAAYREWAGLQLIKAPPIVQVEPLSNLELAELFQLAQEVPTVVRDLLKMRREARTTRRQIVLRKREWPRERVSELIELHQLALFHAGIEHGKARQAYDRAIADPTRGNYKESCRQRERMVTACVTQIATLEGQLQALQAS